MLRALRYSLYIPVIILACFMILPYVWMFTGSFKTVAELSKTPPTFTVDEPSLNNFYDPLGGTNTPGHVEGLFQRFRDTDGGFLRYYANSLFVSFSVTMGAILLASLVAYVLAKHSFPGRQFFFLLFISSMMIPWQVMLIPGYLIVNRLEMSTFASLIIPALPKAYIMFFLRQYMLSLPDELIDSGRIDGASELRIWWSIIMPLIRPALVAMGIFLFLAEWNNFVWPLIVVQEAQNRTLPLALSLLNSSLTGASTQGVLMAAALLTSLPTLILFIVFQRQFVQGIALTGVKG
ncbi:MAG: carbohydrate ABC transporter permease [Anaerolineae bacterium]|nr:carbohydrate ABC transporter permease [Anaerolineae bacterium]